MTGSISLYKEWCLLCVAEETIKGFPLLVGEGFLPFYVQSLLKYCHKKDRECIGRQFGILTLTEKSQQLKKKVLKPDTPHEIRDAFEKHQEELKKPVKGYVIK